MGKMQLKHLFAYLLIYTELMVMGLKDHIFNWIKDHAGLATLVVAAIKDHIWLLISTIMVMAIPVFYVVVWESQLKRFSYVRLLIYGVTACMLYCLEEIPLLSGKTMMVGGGCLFTALAVLEIVNYLRIENDMPIETLFSADANISGFSVVSDKSRLKNVGWDEYANVLISKLLNTNINNESFAVGINGEWGSGKTTFMEVLRNRAQSHAHIVSFNPWLSNSPTQIVKDFFERLKTDFSVDYNHAKSIDEYVDLINDMNLSGSLSNIAKIIKYNTKKDLESVRISVEEILPKDKPVMVFIDDLDRLEKDEIYEVLRLIRNTAKFKNVIYVVAYDKSYISGTLGTKGITAPTEYLMKIFQVEIKLPIYEDALLKDMLIEELTTQLGIRDRMKSDVVSWLVRNDSNKLPLSDILRNFRDVKRFANLLSLDIAHLQQGANSFDVLVSDLCCLELIRYRYEEYYKVLLNDRKQLIVLDPGDNFYELKKKDILPKEVSEDYTLMALLTLLFGARVRQEIDKRAMCLPHNYLNYFSLRPMKDQIGRSLFQNKLKNCSQEEMREFITECLQQDGEKIESLYIRFNEIALWNLNEKIALNYMHAFFSWAEIKEDRNSLKYLPQICYKVFRSDLYKRVELKEIVHNFLLSGMKKLIVEGKHLNVAAMLRDMYGCVYDWDNDEGVPRFFPECLLDNGEINRLMDENMATYLEISKPEESDLLSKNSYISCLVDYSRIKPSDEYQEVPRLLPRKPFIDYFKSRKAENEIEQFYLEFSYDDNALYMGLDDGEVRAELKSKIRRSFGSTQIYNEFLKECFNLTEEEAKVRDKYISNDYVCPIKCREE